MVIFTAFASGNWSNPAIWNGGTATAIPGTGANDTVLMLASTFVVNLDIKASVVSVAGTANILPISGAYTLNIAGVTIGTIPSGTERITGTGVTASLVPAGISGV